MYSYLHILFSMEFNLVSSLYRSARLEFSTLLRFFIPCIFNFRHERLRNFTSTNTFYFVIYLTHSSPLHDEAMHSFVLSSTFTTHDLISILYLGSPSSSHPLCILCLWSLLGGRNPLTALFTFLFSSPCRPRACIYVSQQSCF